MSALTPDHYAPLLMTLLSEAKPPFNDWRPKDTPIASDDDNDVMVEVVCWSNQLHTFLDLLATYSGSALAERIRGSILDLQPPESRDFVDQVLSLLSAAYASASSSPVSASPEFRSASLIHEHLFDRRAQETELDWRAHFEFKLFECLCHSRQTALVEFTPVVVGMAYRKEGVPLSKFFAKELVWSDKRGCYESHLHLRAKCILFRDSPVRVTQEMVDLARGRDQAEAFYLRDSYRRLSQTVSDLPQDVEFSVAGKCREHLDLLIERAAEIGDIVAAERQSLESLRSTLLGVMRDALIQAQNEGGLIALERAETFFLKGRKTFLKIAAFTRPNTPIAQDEIMQSLLCGEVDTVSVYLEALAYVPAAARKGALQQLAKSGAWHTVEILAKGLDIPDLDAKLEILAKACEEVGLPPPQSGPN